MIYYRHNETGEVFAYEQSDLDTVSSIAPLEQALQDAVAALPSDEEDEGYESAKQAVDEAQAALDDVNPVFFKIRDNLANCTEMTAAEVEEHLNPTPTQSYVPTAVSRRQGRLALLNAGKLDDVEAAIDAIEDPEQKRVAQIEYEADTWERSNPFLQLLWAQLGGTEQELDDLFRLGATL